MLYKIGDELEARLSELNTVPNKITYDPNTVYEEGDKVVFSGATGLVQDKIFDGFGWRSPSVISTTVDDVDGEATKLSFSIVDDTLEISTLEGGTGILSFPSHLPQPITVENGRRITKGAHWLSYDSNLPYPATATDLETDYIYVFDVVLHPDTFINVIQDTYSETTSEKIEKTVEAFSCKFDFKKEYLTAIDMPWITSSSDGDGVFLQYVPNTIEVPGSFVVNVTEPATEDIVSVQLAGLTPGQSSSLRLGTFILNTGASEGIQDISSEAQLVASGDGGETLTGVSVDKALSSTFVNTAPTVPALFTTYELFKTEGYSPLKHPDIYDVDAHQTLRIVQATCPEALVSLRVGTGKIFFSDETASEDLPETFQITYEVSDGTCAIAPGAEDNACLYDANAGVVKHSSNLNIWSSTITVSNPAESAVLLVQTPDRYYSYQGSPSVSKTVKLKSAIKDGVEVIPTFRFMNGTEETGYTISVDDFGSLTELLKDGVSAPVHDLNIDYTLPEYQFTHLEMNNGVGQNIEYGAQPWETTDVVAVLEHVVHNYRMERNNIAPDDAGHISSEDTGFYTLDTNNDGALMANDVVPILKKISLIDTDSPTYDIFIMFLHNDALKYENLKSIEYFTTGKISKNVFYLGMNHLSTRQAVRLYSPSFLQDSLLPTIPLVIESDSVSINPNEEEE